MLIDPIRQKQQKRHCGASVIIWPPITKNRKPRQDKAPKPLHDIVSCHSIAPNTPMFGGIFGGSCAKPLPLHRAVMFQRCTWLPSNNGYPLTRDTTMPLTDVAARKAKFDGKTLKLSDEKGLFLLVNKSGKYWRFKYRFGDKENALALGVYPDVSLKTARTKRDEARQLLGEGLDPGLIRKQAKAAGRLAAANNFEALAREWFGIKQASITADHAKKILRSLERDAFPDLKSIPVTEITPPLVLATLRKVESRSVREANRLKQRISAIYRYAIQTGRASYNPAQDMRDVLKGEQKTKMPALPRQQLPAFFADLAALSLYPTIRLALHLLMLTMARPKEIRFATWDEFDFTRNEWRIPGARMKMKEPHIVPLSKQALAVLNEARLFSGELSLVFPGARSPHKPFAAGAFSAAINRMGYKGIATAHGFRAVASTLLNEEGFAPDIIERLLAHKEKDTVRAAYNRAEYLAQRRELLQWLADFYDSQRGSNVLPVNFNRAG